MSAADGRVDLGPLLYELCVDLGFCLPPADHDRLASRQWDRATDLADAILAAEGMEQPYDLRLWRNVRDRIVQYQRTDAQ